MYIDNQQFSAGVYIIFGKHESIVDKILDGRSGYQILNLARPDSFKVPIYFKKEKLQWIPGIIYSHSELPNTLFSSTLHLLQKTNCLIVGTSGLSYDSLIKIIDYFTKNIPIGKRLFFIESTNDYLITSPFIRVTELNIKDIDIILKRKML